jgi:NAD(P)-dependent dehydrogenase (short-subunit alcohol dehydrogenase family)
VTSLDYRGRVAVVTGAGGEPGLGRTYAVLLASRGAKVVVNDLAEAAAGDAVPVSERAESVAAEIRDLGGDAVSDGHTVAQPDGAASIINTAIECFGRADIVINNAGVAPEATFPELEIPEIERIVSTHLLGHIWMTRAVWPFMVKQHYGRIINVSSSLALRGSVLHPIYGAAKLGIVGLTTALALEGNAHGITVNAIMPQALTLGRPGAPAQLLPELVAPVTAYLAHEECTLTGRTLISGGGSLQALRYLVTSGVDHGSTVTIEAVRDSIENVAAQATGLIIDSDA